MGSFKNTLRSLIFDPNVPVFLLLTGAFFLASFFRISATVVLPLEGERLGMSASLVGFLSSLHFYSYALMQPVSGTLHDRHGPVRVVSWALLLTALSCLPMIVSRTPVTLGVWRLLSGFTIAPMYSAALVYQSFAFPQERYCFYAAITIACSSLGSILAVAPLGFVIERFGMTVTFALLAGLPLTLALLLLRRSGDDVVRQAAKKTARRGALSILTDIAWAVAFIFRNRRTRALQILWALSTASIMTFQALWGAPWFNAAFHGSAGAARFWSSLVGVGGMLGPILTSGIVLTKEHLPRAVRRASIVNALCWFLLLAVVGWGRFLSMAGLVALILGLASGIRGVFSLAAVTACSPSDKRGVIFGAMNMIGVLGIVVFQWGTGVILDHFPGALPGTFTARGYFVSFAAVSIAMAVGLSALRDLGTTPFEYGEPSDSEGKAA